MQKKYFYIFGGVLSVIIFSLIVYFSATFKGAQNYTFVDYSVPNVPYYGFYNKILLPDLNVPYEIPVGLVSAVGEVVDYWGDPNNKNFSFTKKLDVCGKNLAKSQIIENFATSSGYVFYKNYSFAPKDALNIIRQMVNSDKKIPVIVYQKYSLKSDSRIYRLVIGISDTEKKIISHDYFFGNNYEISYDSFERMFDTEDRAIVAFWPGADLGKQMEKRTVSPYAERADFMNSVGNYFSEYIDALNNANNKESLENFKNFTEDERFELLAPVYRIFYLTKLTEQYLIKQNGQEAQRIINEKVLPINKNLGNDFPNFSGQNEYYYGDFQVTAYPYYDLARAYMILNQKDKALSAIDTGLEIAKNKNFIVLVQKFDDLKKELNVK